MPQALSADNIQRASSQEKAGIYLVISEKVITFAPDDESLIWLVARHQMN